MSHFPQLWGQIIGKLFDFLSNFFKPVCKIDCLEHENLAEFIPFEINQLIEASKWDTAVVAATHFSIFKAK